MMVQNRACASGTIFIYFFETFRVSDVTEKDKLAVGVFSVTCKLKRALFDSHFCNLAALSNLKSQYKNSNISGVQNRDVERFCCCRPVIIGLKVYGLLSCGNSDDFEWPSRSFIYCGRYDTTRLDIFVCTQKNSQLNLPHRTEIQNFLKLKKL